MNVKKLYKKIIPTDDYEHRKDFYNEDLIDNLTEKKKGLIENMLIDDLKSRHDLLVIETLAHINSVKSTEIIEKRLKGTEKPFDKIIIAWCLYKLNYDKHGMVDIAYDNFLLINNVYDLKTGKAKVTQKNIDKYNKHVPGKPPVKEIKPDN